MAESFSIRIRDEHPNETITVHSSRVDTMSWLVPAMKFRHLRQLSLVTWTHVGCGYSLLHDRHHAC
jgi:hypothetical protein